MSGAAFHLFAERDDAADRLTEFMTELSKEAAMHGVASAFAIERVRQFILTDAQPHDQLLHAGAEHVCFS